MAADYTTGSASSFSDVLSALNTFLTANGWTSVAATGGGRIFSKGAAYVRLRADDTTSQEALYLLGGTGVASGALSNPAPNEARMASAAPVPIVFPITYELYVNDGPDEVYIVVSYGGNKYQHMHFGVSDVPGIGGTGLWYSSAMRDDNDTTRVYMYATPQTLETTISGQSLGYFIDQVSGRPAHFIHCELEGAAGWHAAAAGNYNPASHAGYLAGQAHMAGLLQALPSKYNESEVLVPIYAMLIRTDGTRTIVAVMRHARLMRIDNLPPGEVITYGADQWKTYPLYAKNLAERNGVGWSTGADHSGTFGVALRYGA